VEEKQEAEEKAKKAVEEKQEIEEKAKEFENTLIQYRKKFGELK